MVNSVAQRTAYLANNLISEKGYLQTITLISQTCALCDQYTGAKDPERNILRCIYKSNLEINFL